MLADSEFLKALYYVAPLDIRKAYRDAVDFLFCELLIGYKDLCRRFYLGESPPLHALPIATDRRAERWDAFLMGALLLADELRKQRKSMTWERFRELIIEAAVTPR